MSSTGKQPLNRHVLPIPHVDRPAFTPYDARDAQYEPIAPLAPPAGAPNILLVLLDDAGFGSSTVFGGPCRMPRLERLAGRGLLYSKFHTTALCSPTRAALLTGRNHHTVNMGAITEIATSAPGKTSARTNDCAPLAETLKLNGYSTAQIGKCHEVPVWETSPMGPYEHWPLGSGFEYFFGFLGGETDQYYPTLYENLNPVEPAGKPEDGYTLNEELADKAIGYLRRRQALAPTRPFFMYYAPGATHAPHHVPAEWADRYKGKFDKGWDRQREETLAKQIELGIVPADTKLTQRHEGLPGWEETDPEMRPVYARQMELYAGFMEQTDHHIGRVIDELQAQGELDNTLIFYIVGDNGASAEGNIHGTFNEMIALNGLDLETPESIREKLDLLGTAESSNHYSACWAHAMNTPFQWTKQVASHYGGTRNGMVVHWPERIKAKDGVRDQFFHVIDIAPTILEAAGLPEPSVVNGVTQKPYEGISLAYSFDDFKAPERHSTQYFEMLGNRGIYHQGWTAVTKHRTPWETGETVLLPFDEDVWELYDTNVDFSQSNDLAKVHPEKLKELQRLWLIEAVKHNVLPLDDRAAERAVPEIAGRPVTVQGNSQRLFQGMRIPEGTMVSVKNRAHAVTAAIAVPEKGAAGVICAVGGSTGGWAIHVQDGRLVYTYNYFGLDRTSIRSDKPLGAGEQEVRMEFAYAGEGLGKGGKVTLFVNGEAVGSGAVEATISGAYTASETFDVGLDSGSPVTPDYPATGNGFTGRIDWLQIDAGPLNPKHEAEEYRLKLAVARGVQ
ncbi:arylsulfatase [Sandaracinobacteroides sayramensis]|uniref:arylsulfatase n=1 Tax=Sandaracinobacteroides sayramensis TaxID=2913411 RepID=UPI0023431BB1|nr:arylsulfatase [Sandaracinobacteroides sayramensis]